MPSDVSSRSVPVSWPLVLSLGLVGLVRPLLSITGLADAWGRPAAPLAATAVVTVVWVATAVAVRAERPVLTLALAGLTYAVAATLVGGVLSTAVHGEVRGPLGNPWAILPTLALNAGWGALSGFVAAGLMSLRR